LKTPRDSRDEQAETLTGLSRSPGIGHPLWLAAVALAASAVVACPAANEHYESVDLTLVNRTQTRQPIALYKPTSALDCAAVETGDLGTLATATFMMASCLAIDPGGSTPFGSTLYLVKTLPPAAPGPGPDCEAVVVRAAGLADMVLAWPTVAPETDGGAQSDLYLEGAGDRLFIAATELISATPATFTLPTSGCGGLP
jgi:hypothetical protein